MPSPRFLIGLVLVLVVCVATAYVLTQRGKDDPGTTTTAQPITVTCLGGSEKKELMADPEVRQLLKDRYGLTVVFNPLGSYDQVQLSADELAKKKADCLWPSSASAQNVFEKLHPGAYPQYRAENLLQSPEVVYAGPQGTDALIKAGIVTQRDNRYFIVDMKKLLLDHVLKRTTWESLGATKLRGPIAVSSTDAAKSNSGFTMAQLQLNIIATDNAFEAPSLAQARKVLGTVRAVYDAQGLQAAGSDTGFQQWLTQGAEFHSPLYAGYENQLIQLMAQPGVDSASVLTNVRVLYPEPTIYSDHPILALNDNAIRFQDAMKDPQLQGIAWRKYGFRSVQLGVSKVADFPKLPLAENIRTTQPPNAEVTLALLACVSESKCS
ncbi:hypothetical protein QEZ54_33215 [Catellatospora sp. KI3]|uniref:hypothetical protein n=1 Tax=Catellatospora sp. KI3 TaxID=3041620 RepID=UPI00248263C3|nr:hypothetical protein [Catellatospora sp. KI3]MDI1465844.1 hypothetical protein [Catellatospora sp. KI3]